MDVAQVPQIARARPKQARGDGGVDGRLQIAVRFLPRVRHQHPAARFVERDDGAILVQDGKFFAIAEFEMICFGHPYVSKSHDAEWQEWFAD